MSAASFLQILSCLALTLTALVFPAWAIPPLSNFEPLANQGAIVTLNNARFTVLTDRLIRMEYHAQRQFNDRPSYAFPFRAQQVPTFNVTSGSGGWVTIQTKYLQLRYLNTTTVSFNQDNLAVTITYTNGSTTQWAPLPWSSNIDHAGNLYGTVRTLDQLYDTINLDCYTQDNAGLHCTYGLVSTSGFAVVDDTHKMLFTSDGQSETDWPWIYNSNWAYETDQSGDMCQVDTTLRRDCGWSGITQTECVNKGCCWNSQFSTADNGFPVCFYSTQATQDLYLFGHGYDFKGALADFIKVGGRIPIPPRYGLGVFFSRYWAFNEEGIKEVVLEYVEHDVPLDNLVTDMDWHLTFYKQADAGVRDQAGQTIGWTGFTWDNKLFPDPNEYLQWCRDHNLHNTLNVHPASGMQPWEEKYPQMAVAMGIDPSTNIYVPFNVTDSKYITNWNNIVLSPFEQSGIQFWWLDWQQGEDPSQWMENIPSTNPTMWLNYIFFTNPTHWQKNNVRPFILHRWGGLGNHRYQVGFSGDVAPSWTTLQFETYFTATAANVGYGYWSHDLGGHISRPSDELYTRWLQFGALSPMFRSHCTKDASNDRRIWVYSPDYYPYMRNAIKLRQALMPYLYTSAHYTYETGLSICLPLYYEYPQSPQSYNYQNEYFFGSYLLTSPVYSAVDVNGLAQTKVWIPDGSIYHHFFTGKEFVGPMEFTDNSPIDYFPLYVKAGAILPFLPDFTESLGQAQFNPSILKLVTYLSTKVNSGQGYVYEDDGISTKYMEGAYCTQNFYYTVGDNGNSVTFGIDGYEGIGYDGQLKYRQYVLVLRNSPPAAAVSINNNAIPSVTFEDESQFLLGSMMQNEYAYYGDNLALYIFIRSPLDLFTGNAISIQFLFPLSDSLFSQVALSGYAGSLSRFIDSKMLLDNQWGTSTQVYMDDYPNLLFATESGEQISAQPLLTKQILTNFTTWSKNALVEVANLSTSQALKTQILAQLQSV